MQDHTKNSYILASSRSWGVNSFYRNRERFSGYWIAVSSQSDLEVVLQNIDPRYIFFTHWSSIVPEHILTDYECVCFHMTDVPYGRGGSPLQNLIKRGHEETMLTALKMNKQIDAGPVYDKRPLSLSGSAEEIFERASDLAMEMIETFIINEPVPVPQEGEPTIFRRRKPDESEIADHFTMAELYDHIRMLDAPGYPKAFFRIGELRAELTDAKYRDGAVEANVRFQTEKKKI